MAFKSIFATWEDARARGALPPGWDTWEKFRAWVIENGYKAEYGYKGEFSSEGCSAAMPRATDLRTLTLDKMKKLAADMGIDTGKAKTKAEFAALITAAETEGGEKDAG